MGLDESGLGDDHLDDVAQVALHRAQLVHERDEAGDGGASARAVLVVLGCKAQRLLEADAGVAACKLDSLDGRAADAALRRVDDALEADLVTRVHDSLEVRHHIANLGAVEELGAADDAVRYAGAKQRVFQLTRLRVGAVEEREVGVAPVLGTHELVDLGCDEPRLVALVARQIARDLLALGVGGEERLGLAVGVVGDDGVRGR